MMDPDEVWAVIEESAAANRKLDRLILKSRGHDPAAVDLADAITHAPPAMLRLVVDSFAEIVASERRSKGNKASATKRKAQPAIPPWMIPVFNEAYALVEQDGKARVGHVALLGVAWRLAGPDHPGRDQLTEHRARQYLNIRPKSPR